MLMLNLESLERQISFAGTGLPEGSPVRPDRIIKALTELF
jgi:hypothetical protein